MTNINLTEKETAIMTVFGSLVDEDSAAAQMEAGPVYAAADELARFAEMEVKTIKSVTNSLIKKGLVIGTESAETGQARYELTEAGVTWAFDQRTTSDSVPAETAPALNEDEAVSNIKGQLEAALAQEGATKCSALRAVAAAAGDTPRSVFIKAAELVGINKGTAARQWQEGRAEETAAPDIEDMKTQVAEILMGIGQDEAIATLLEHVSAKGLRAIMVSFAE